MQTQTDSYIETFTGKKFNFIKPDPETIDIIDIAHSLSMQCRFTGHTKKFYSIAEHSLIVSDMCSDENKLWGLLHDATEAYLTDVASPVKPHLTNYKSMERVLMKCLCEKFNLPEIMPDEVKINDVEALRQEAFVLMPSRGYGWVINEELKPFFSNTLVSCYSNEEAKDKFLKEFYELTK